MDRQFTTMLEHSLGDGVDGAALVDRDGHAIAIAGAIAEEEAMPLAALVMHRCKSPDLSVRLFGGEVVSLALDDRDVAVAVAKRQLFLVASLGPATPAALARVSELRDDVERMLADATTDVALPPWSGGGGGSGSGPAAMQLVEFGLTVRRPRGQA